MNHLAHALLAGDDEDRVLGGLLGDFLRGAVPTTLRPGVQDGLRLHRAIDAYTDRHPVLAALRPRFQAPWRRYAGIILDVWFDHLLARDFTRWSAQPLPAYAAVLQALLQRRAAELPPALQRFAAYMRRHDLPAAYADRDVLAQVFAGLSTRLSRTNPLADALHETARLEPELGAAFAEFFPQLLQFAAAWRAATAPEARRGTAAP